MFRQVLDTIRGGLASKQNPILLLLGLRQTGKSTLAQTVCNGRTFMRFDFDLLSDIAEFTQQNRQSLALFAQRYKNEIIIVDEVQKSPEAVGIIKYLYDTYKLKFILTGLSELKIRRGIGDSLTGRVKEYHLYPLSLHEMNVQSGLSFNYEINQQLLLRTLIWGSLPQLLNIPPGEYSSYLSDFANSLLSKDILEISGTRNPAQIFHLAQLLAYQIGQIVNINELAQNTSLSRLTVVHYLRIFEEMGLIVKASPISANERKAITKRSKYYFTDLGIRNALIHDFTDFDQRQDRGGLLENAVFMGIKRDAEYKGEPYVLGFFRSQYGSEIDIVKKIGKQEELYEVKTSSRKQTIRDTITVITLKNAQNYLS